MLIVLTQRFMKYGLKEVLKVQKRLGFEQHVNQYYFAYGANLSMARFSKFNIKAEVVGAARIQDHQINFNVPCEYVGKGFASIEPHASSAVWGTLYKINPEDLLMLDVIEWAPFGFYDRLKVNVETSDHKVFPQVWAYVAKHPKQGLIPSRGYRDFIIKQGEEAQFPESYLKPIRETKVADDFKLDPGFRLSNPGKRRLFEGSLFGIYQKHDELREKLTKVIP